MEMLSMIIKCIIVYFVIILALRLMGKREVGELSIFDMVIYLVMSELLALTISEDESIFQSLIPIITLVLLQIFLAYFSLKNKTFRDIFDGKSEILIHNGYVFQNRMRKNRYNIDDLMSQLRSSNISSFDEIAFAILENNGTLTILKKDSCNLIHPDPIILDGKIDYNTLNKTHLTKQQLIDKLNGVKIKDVFLCLLQKDGLFILMKHK